MRLLARKKVVFVIVEGPSDDTALGVILNQIYRFYDKTNLRSFRAVGLLKLPFFLKIFSIFLLTFHQIAFRLKVESVLFMISLYHREQKKSTVFS